MDTGQLNAFDRIVREGSFSRAATALGIGQPAVSSRIQSLEDALGGALFTRGRTITLTALGEAFLPYARRALDVVREGVESAQLTQTGKRGRVRLGVLGSLAAGLAAPALVEFMREHPEVDHAVRATDHEGVMTLLADGLVDLGFVVWPCAAPIMQTLAPIFTFREPILFVTHPEHVLAKGRPVSEDDVAALARPLIQLRWWPKHDPRVTAIAERSRGATELPMEIARHLVLAGAGAGFFSRTYVKGELADGSLAHVAVRGLSLHRDVALVRRRGAPLSPAAAELVQALRKQTLKLGFKPKQGALRGTERTPRDVG